MRSQPPQDLDWLAFLYVSDELGDVEREAFEEQLAQEQAAREAVARAIELAQTLAAARELDEIVVRSANAPSRASARRASWSYPVAWMGIGAAACLSLVSIWALWPPLHSKTSGVAATAGQALELARAWSSVREEWGQHFPSEGVTSNMLAADDALDELASSPAPSWMLTALSSEMEESGDGVSGRANDSGRTNEIREN